VNGGGEVAGVGEGRRLMGGTGGPGPGWSPAEEQGVAGGAPETAGARAGAAGEAGGAGEGASADPRDADETEAPFAAALAALPGAGPAVLAVLLRDWSPMEAWNRVKAGRLVRPGSGRPGSGQLDLDEGRLEVGLLSAYCPGPVPAGDTGSRARGDRSWQEASRAVDPPGRWHNYANRGIGVTWLGARNYPPGLVGDPERPGVLFWRGSLGQLDRPCVAIVGTRQATPDGRSVAFEMGRDLAAAGVCVVSGLALGIDGAAHAGVLQALGEAAAGGSDTGNSASFAGPAGVAASGVDVPYPRRHAHLWEHIAAAGVMLSETPPGRPAQAWRFPARNRIIAALSRMVVVVESHRTGGSLITAEAAIARGIEVRVVPGPVHSPASAGSNQLLYDGPGPVRHARDVLDGLGIFLSGPVGPGSVGPVGNREDTAAGLDVETARVLKAVLWRPTSLNQVVAQSAVPVGAASRALDRLETVGLVGREGDWWVRRAPRPAW
jgi:DNA processing protein